MIVTIRDRGYKEIRDQGLFFVKYDRRIIYDRDGNEVRDDSVWQSVDYNMGICFSANGFGQSKLRYCLCIIEKVIQSNNASSVDVYFHEFSASNEDDCIRVLSNCIKRGCDDDKYAFVELLWVLDKKELEERVLLNAICKYDSRVILYILSVIKSFCRCLSLNKQNRIKSIFDCFGAQYEIYRSNIITDVLEMCGKSNNNDELNIFQLVDEIIGKESINPPSETDKENNNILLQLKRWAYSESSLEDYNILTQLYPMVAEPIRLEIVKRYFHDIRLGNTLFDYKIVRQFIDNHFDNVIRYRYASETPADYIDLTTPLLCDSILTLYNSKGKSFQTFNGILDFAIMRCDKAHPSVRFNLERFIPTCNNGAVYNDKFKGFIDVKFVQRINKEKLSDSFLLECICGILDKYGEKQKYPVCKYGDGSRIDRALFANCSKDFVLKDGKKVNWIAFSIRVTMSGQWSVSKKNIDILNSFLEENVANNENHTNVIINLSMVSLDVFREYILSLPSRFVELGNDEFLINYSNSCSEIIQQYDLMLIGKFSDIIRMRIYPQKETNVGFDAFGFWKEIRNTLPHQLNIKSAENETAKKAYMTKEMDEVYQRIVNSIIRELGICSYNDSYFEIPYSKETLEKLINKYYFKPINRGYREENVFLKNATNTSYFCAPELSKTNNQAINLPFYWCRGKECFHNNLEKQVLSEMNDWHSYSLYHLIEIIGYPKLHKTVVGNEPDSVIRNYIAVVNKSMQMFRRLKCRSCGHLMFSDKSSGYNRYNWYSCINPSCPKKGTPVYLNFCYKCKKGLIDSRDTKQCPNGWYICPECFSCCDDSQYERQAQRYTLSSSPVPDRINKMRGHGHNDKNIYYCPSCGNHLEVKEGARGKYFCQSCQKELSLPKK